MRKKEKIKNRVSALLLSGVMLSGLIAPAFYFNARAEAIEVLNSTCTVADMILSYCASSGTAILNDTIINDVYQNLGSSFGTLQSFYNNGLLTYADGSFIDTGLSVNIESAIENVSSIDIGALFNQTADQNASGVAMTGAASLGGIAAGVASTGVLPLVAGVAVEGWAGFQLGTLIANELGLYGKNVASGVAINSPANILSKIPNGQQCIAYLDNNASGDYLTGYATYCYQDSSTFYYGVYLPAGFGNGYRMQMWRGQNIWEGSVSPNMANRYQLSDSLSYGGSSIAGGIGNKFDNVTEFNNALASWVNGSATPKRAKSPDIVGSNGNVQGNYNADNGNYTIPDALPQVDPSTQSVNPSGLSLEDWLRFANDAKGNYTSGDPDLNTEIFQEIINRLIENMPTPSPTPTPTPDGDTYPYPGNVPNPNPVPDPDYQPETKPQPDFTEKQTENETDITEGDPWTTPDLLDKFPFCIPKDIYRVFTKLDSKARSAPHIQWRFHPNNMIDYTFDIDFSEWDSIATLLRTLELLAFIVGLAIGTRRLIIGG